MSFPRRYPSRSAFQARGPRPAVYAACSSSPGPSCVLFVPAANHDISCTSGIALLRDFGFPARDLDRLSLLRAKPFLQRPDSFPRQFLPNRMVQKRPVRSTASLMHFCNTKSIHHRSGVDTWQTTLLCLIGIASKMPHLFGFRPQVTKVMLVFSGMKRDPFDHINAK